MMGKRKTEKSISALCAPVLLLILAAGILTVLLGSASVYQRLDQRGQESGDRRTAALYLTGKLRQSSGSAAVVPFGQGEALEITETVDGNAYVTRIYCFDGWLRELFTPEKGAFAPEDGEKVLPMAAVEFSLQGELLYIHMTDPQGKAEMLQMVLLVGEGVRP